MIQVVWNYCTLSSNMTDLCDIDQKERINKTIKNKISDLVNEGIWCKCLWFGTFNYDLLFFQVNAGADWLLFFVGIQPISLTHFNTLAKNVLKKFVEILSKVENANSLWGGGWGGWGVRQKTNFPAINPTYMYMALWICVSERETWGLLIFSNMGLCKKKFGKCSHFFLCTLHFVYFCPKAFFTWESYTITSHLISFNGTKRR